MMILTQLKVRLIRFAFIVWKALHCYYPVDSWSLYQSWFSSGFPTFFILGVTTGCVLQVWCDPAALPERSVITVVWKASDYRVNKHIRPIIDRTACYYAVEHVRWNVMSCVHRLRASHYLPDQGRRILKVNCSVQNGFNSGVDYIMNCDGK